jgi:hypothetical protein
MKRTLATLCGAGLLIGGCFGKSHLDFQTTIPAGPTDPVIQQVCGAATQPGHTMIHRLDNVEYNNTVRDLLFTTATPADNFESSSVGSSGFTNQSDVLTLSDQIVADYANAASALADGVLATAGTPGGAFATLAGCAATTTSPSTTCVQSVIQNLAQRAFRRPIDATDLQTLMTVYGGESTFADGFHDVIVAVLIDPRFLFSYIDHPSPNDPTVTATINDYELASRLSYALWQSMPDDALLAIAAEGQLKDPTILETQIIRMLGDPKALSFATTWRKDWAHLTLLDGTGGYGGLPQSVTDDLRQETQLVIQDIILSNSSPLDLVTGDQTFVNQDVAQFYGWNLPTVTSSTFVKVPIPDANRRGVLTDAAIMLTVGGGETYTHPVQRGRWVMDSLLCNPPGAPPPGVPSLDTGTPSNLPMRQRLTIHVSSPACSGCHQIMDVYGLGLENFDMQGKWRTDYAALNNAPIDASGVLPDGRSFSGPGEMISVLAADPAVSSCIAQKVMAYSLARPVAGVSDICVSQALGANYIQPDSHFSDLFTHLAMSPQFLEQQGAAP